MKKIILGLFLSLFCISNVFAAPPPPPHKRPPHPVPISIMHHPKPFRHRHYPLENFVAGVIGSAVGSYMIGTTYQTAPANNQYIIIQSPPNQTIIQRIN